VRPRSDWGIACLGLGSRWPPNGRQFSLLLYLPQGVIYWCQRSQATWAARPPQRVHQWKHGRSLIDGIDFLDRLGFPISLYSSHLHCLIFVIISMYLFGFRKLALEIFEFSKQFTLSPVWIGLMNHNPFHSTTNITYI